MTRPIKRRCQARRFGALQCSLKQGHRGNHANITDSKPEIPKSAMPPGKGPWKCNKPREHILLELKRPIVFRLPKAGEFYWGIQFPGAEISLFDFTKGVVNFGGKRVILTPVKTRKKGK